STIACRLRLNRSSRLRRTTTMRFGRLMCRMRSESASFTRMSEARCSTPIPATRGASTCSMVPTTTSTLCPKAAMRTASNSRWSGYAGTISIEVASGKPTPFLDALQRAFGLDRNFRIGARRGTSDDAELLVAWLVARHFNVFGINLLAEARNLVGAEQVG